MRGRWDNSCREVRRKTLWTIHQANTNTCKSKECQTEKRRGGMCELDDIVSQGKRHEVRTNKYQELCNMDLPKRSSTHHLIKLGACRWHSRSTHARCRLVSPSTAASGSTSNRGRHRCGTSSASGCSVSSSSSWPLSSITSSTAASSSSSTRHSRAMSSRRSWNGR